MKFIIELEITNKDGEVDYETAEFLLMQVLNYEDIEHAIEVKSIKKLNIRK